MANNNSSNNGRGARRRRKPDKKKRPDPKKFWGDTGLIPELDDGSTIRITSEPDAVVRSLGRPPLSVQQNAAELHFSTLYTRAVMLASALAAAGDMVEAEDL